MCGRGPSGHTERVSIGTDGTQANRDSTVEAVDRRCRIVGFSTTADTSRSNTRHRRSQWKATAPDLVPVTVDGETYQVPRPLVRAVARGYVSPKVGR